MSTLANNRNAKQIMREHGLTRSFERTFTLEELNNTCFIACHYGSNGRVFIIPQTNSEPCAATGTVTVRARLSGVDEDVVDGVVSLAETFPATYKKPRFGGIAEHVVITADAVAGCDSLKVIVERY